MTTNEWLDRLMPRPPRSRGGTCATYGGIAMAYNLTGAMVL
jgi:hypothetical protein